MTPPPPSRGGRGWGVAGTGVGPSPPFPSSGRGARGSPQRLRPPKCRPDAPERPLRGARPVGGGAVSRRPVPRAPSRPIHSPVAPLSCPARAAGRGVRFSGDVALGSVGEAGPAVGGAGSRVPRGDGPAPRGCLWRHGCPRGPGPLPFPGSRGCPGPGRGRGVRGRDSPGESLRRATESQGEREREKRRSGRHARATVEDEGGFVRQGAQDRNPPSVSSVRRLCRSLPPLSPLSLADGAPRTALPAPSAPPTPPLAPVPRAPSLSSAGPFFPKLVGSGLLRGRSPTAAWRGGGGRPPPPPAGFPSDCDLRSDVATR